MSVTQPALVDKIAQLAETATAPGLSSAEASSMLERLRHDYPDMDKFLSRKFTRLPAALQRTIVDLLQAAQARAYTSLLREWSRTTTVSLALRTRALMVLESLGEPIDTPYREALVQAEQTLSQLRVAPASPLTATAELQPNWRDAILDLPLALALDLSHDLVADHPTIALAVLRALLPIVDTKDCRLLVERLANIPLMDSVMTLQDLLTNTTDKTLQKTIKKALHRLRAQGFVSDNMQKRSHAVVGAVTHRLEHCLASHIDGAGNRALWMIRTKPFGGYHIAYVVINYGTGIQSAAGLQASKRDLPEILSKAQERVRLIELDPGYCQYQVALAQQMNLDTGTPVPEEFFALRSIIGEADTTFAQAIIYSVLSEADLQEAQAYTEYAVGLLNLPEFGGWTLPASIIQKYADHLLEIEDSQIVIGQSLKQERIDEVYARATEEVLGEQSRRIIRLRLEEMAYFLWRTERRREALWAVAAAQTMQEDVPTRPRRNRFIEALLEQSLERAKERPSSRIIQPFSRLPNKGVV